MNEIKNKILNEYEKGNIVVATLEGLQGMPLDEFIRQPTDGMLYDLNRIEPVVLTFLPDPKWVNDYAVAKVIRALKNRVDELEASKDCNKTCVEPVFEQDKSITEKAMWWIANGQIGLSSKTMWNFFMGNKEFPVYHPYDPSDFSRCWKLLETVPEWKIRVSELSVLSKEWSALSKNWEKLTEMYEQNEKENWENHKQIGMYEFMQKLLNY